ncbi:MAG: 2-amino-4-hydroxy-6-hydroxymethyldihydropteridine diphosphokinase [Candidatus Schekmanbacteria bacterium RBG_13_48_7]|uniref:2-amino-4-hydroxy-6-hydroxymethyldihydropteridine diphosphokinase n=1 Tax=Candidatus Schekmanbacteria bacterium RBG_13_48_7 TaxID=1817878 RepID=A0A1F7RPI0_9BACT|nr:MAG: 2-amino-4-hydroxy-6-hydroxymethyldihydropteridine diphosphokinase [Candidatus Schekmanbacteria bacterium RBG_13_48_7]
MSSESQVYIGIGSNLGDPFVNTINAMNLMSGLEHTKLVNNSSLYWSDPQSPVSQNIFLNSVVLLNTNLSPEHLLRELKNIEKQMGRIQSIRWGPRIIDLDILFYENLIIVTKDLVIPHPRIHKRLFSMVPLLEITPDLQHPLLNGRLSQYLDSLHAMQFVTMAYQRIQGTIREFFALTENENQRSKIYSC